MNNKLLLNSTLEELVEALLQGLGLALSDSDKDKLAVQPKKHFVYGLKGLAALMGCSISTAARLKQSGVLDAAICQQGKIIVIDADMALDLLNVHKKKHRGLRKGYK